MISSPFTFDSLMKHSMLTPAFAACIGLLYLLCLPTVSKGQCDTITGFTVKSLINITFDATITFSDNSTDTKAVAPSSEVLFVAPSGKTITKLTVGTKTVNLPMHPSPQSGWSFSTPPGGTVYGLWHDYPAYSWSYPYYPYEDKVLWAYCGILFSY